MSLTLRLRDVAFLENGMPVEFVLHRRGAFIGRSPTCDWSLPDPRNHVSSRHCEVRFEAEGYLLVDISTNGTFLNGAAERMSGPHRLAHGDRIAIGPYEVETLLSGGAAHAASPGTAAGHDASVPAGTPAWGGWDAHGGAAPPPPPPPEPNGWDRLSGDDGWNPPSSGMALPPPAPTPSPPSPSNDRWGSSPQVGLGNNDWTPERSGAAPPAVASPWRQPEAARDGASDWSSAAPDRAPPPSPDDIWGRIAEGHVVDWARGGFGHGDLGGNAALGVGGGSAREGHSIEAASRNVGDWATPALPAVARPADDSNWGSAPAAGRGNPAPPASPNDAWGAPATPPAPAVAPPPAPQPRSPSAPQRADDALLRSFLDGAGMEAGSLKAGAADTLAQAGQLLRQLVAGMVVMVEARARAKSQMGAEATSFSFDGNNPLKFARSPEQALAQLINPKERGFMDAPAAVADAFGDLQSHQMATLKAMQGALRATLDRFSPTAIRGRAEARGLFGRILPGAREAALWQAYEREYGGVKQGSDEAFMEVFAREFRRAYEELSRASSSGQH